MTWWAQPSARLNPVVTVDNQENPLPPGSPLAGRNGLSLTTGMAGAGIPVNRMSVTVDTGTLDRMIDAHRATWLTHALVPNGAANNLPVLFAGKGAAFKHNMVRTFDAPPGSHPRNGQSSIDTIRYGTGTCDEINTLLFRVAVALSKENEASAQQGGHRTTHSTSKVPMRLVYGGGHTYFQNGDMRAPGPVVDACAWVSLPTVQPHENSVFNDPTKVFAEYIAGASGFDDFSMIDVTNGLRDQFSEEHIHDALVKKNFDLPPPGPDLLQRIKERTVQSEQNWLFNVNYSAKNPYVRYQDHEGRALLFNHQPLDHFKTMMSVFSSPDYRAMDVELWEKNKIIGINS